MLGPTFSWAVLRKLLSFGLPLVPTSLAWWVFTLSDRLILGKLTTLHELGLYSVAVTASALLGLFVGSLGQAWSPHAVHAYEQRPDDAAVLFSRMLTYILGGFGALAVFISLFGREALRLLTTSSFLHAAVAIPPLSLGLLAYASTQVTAMPISLRNRTIYLAVYAWMAAALNVALNLLLVPRFGMIGSAWATTIAYSFLSISYLLRSQRLWHVQYEGRRAAVILSLTVVFALPGPYLPHTHVLLDVPIKVACFALYAALLVALRAFDRREWRALATILRPTPVHEEPA